MVESFISEGMNCEKSFLTCVKHVSTISKLNFRAVIFKVIEAA